MLIGIKSIKPNFPVRLLNLGLAAVGLIAITAVIFMPYVPYNIDLKIGDVAKETVFAPRYVVFESTEDKKKTQELRDKRAQLVEDIYSVDTEKNKQIVAQIVATFTQLQQLKSTPQGARPKELSFLSRQDLSRLQNLDDKLFSSVEYVTVQNAERMLSDGLTEVKEAAVRDELKANTRRLKFEPALLSSMVKILMAHLEPNMAKDKLKTEAAVAAQLEAIKPFVSEYRQGEPVIYKNERVTQSHIDGLVALNIYGLKADFYRFGGILIANFLLFLLVERFIYHFYKKIYNNSKYFVLVYLIAFIVVLIAWGIQHFQEIPHVGSLKYLIPIPLSAMMICFLVTPNISLLCGTVISLMISMMYGTDFSLFLYLFLSNCVTSFATYKRYKRTELMKSGYVVGVAHVGLVIMSGLFLEMNDPLWYGINSVIGLCNGIFSSMLSLALLPYLEGLFKITTSQSLLEHSNLNHPLLKRLMMTAPGTYQHSLMVANLAEAAAEAIDADVILARIGAYFHDIGKMKRPQFFTENQFGADNPHESLSPRMSKLIIGSHPKDGVELANKHKLPSVLKEFMMEHHGTSLVSFFYSQAMAEESFEDTEIAKEEFRYPGPKPHFKESGIVMLADSSEAAMRSMEKPTPQKIENLLERIFEDKINDKQLVNCPLSMREIETIKATFLSVFKGIYHSRLDYQEEIEQIVQQSQPVKVKKNGRSD